MLVLKLDKEQACLGTKKENRRNIVPSSLNIFKFREAITGCVAIGCENKVSITEHKSQLADNLNNEVYTVELPQLDKYKLGNMNAIRKFIGHDDSDQDIVDETVSSNLLVITKNFRFLVLVTLRKDCNVNAVLCIIFKNTLNRKHLVE